MTNTNELISKMKKFGDRQEDLANALNLSLSRTNAKINNKDGAEFTLIESNIIRIRYHLTDAEYVEIFCTQSVHQEGTVSHET